MRSAYRTVFISDSGEHDIANEGVDGYVNLHITKRHARSPFR
jgi:hypothetical protein